jgi:hypothetical protein
MSVFALVFHSALTYATLYAATCRKLSPALVARTTANANEAVRRLLGGFGMGETSVGSCATAREDADWVGNMGIWCAVLKGASGEDGG